MQEFYEELGLGTLAIYVDASGKAPRELSALGVPTTLLIDREGKEVGRLLGPAEWDSPEMVAFIRGQIQRPAGASLRPASDERACVRQACGGRSQAQARASPCLPVTGRHHLCSNKET